MKKDTVKRELHQYEGYPVLLDHVAELLPDETDFTILQIDPDGNVRILHPIQRPGFAADDLLQEIRGRDVSRDAFQRLTDFIESSILIEVSDEGEINKLSVPDE